MVREEVLRDVPSDLREVADGEDIILLGLISRWEDVGVVSYIDRDQVARRKLFANFDQFSKFLSRLFIDTERSRLGNARYFPLINGIVSETKNGCSCIVMLNETPSSGMDGNVIYLISSVEEDEKTERLTVYWGEKGTMLPHVLQEEMIIRELKKLFKPGKTINKGSPDFDRITSLCGYTPKNEKIFIPDALDNKIKNILIRSELRKYFLQKLAAVCLSDNIQPLLDQIKQPGNREIPIASLLELRNWTENLLETAWTVLAHEMLAPPQRSWLRQTKPDVVNYFEEESYQLEVAAHEDELLIHHLIAWRTKISKAFSSRSQAMRRKQNRKKKRVLTTC